MATQDEKNRGGAGDAEKNASPEASEKNHKYSEEDHDHADWEHEGGNPGHVHDHVAHREKIEQLQRQLAEEQLRAAEAKKKEAANSGDGSVRDVKTDTSALQVPMAVPNRLDQISEENMTLFKLLAGRIWNDGFAFIGGVIPMKPDGRGGYMPDEARQHGVINNIGSANEKELGKLFLWLAMETADLTGEVEAEITKKRLA